MDGTGLASASTGGQILIWEVYDNRHEIIQMHSSVTESIAWSKNETTDMPAYHVLMFRVDQAMSVL